ncbi:PhnD/SsuA/transferrin family substrate-binding protein [Oceanisphaera pacifica]|uniref:PhnD/SsuA/transferrin family substrate-binding protein n=1 Tax=Oceanisphaera pacifica TaxID=2818389 RepID=UPI001FB11B50|nr:PhnD/SsuA/transferrin family substrate-binding protein [Oceanisphaera pacifica]
MIWNRFLSYLMAALPLLLLSFSAISQQYQVGFLAVRGEAHSQAQWAPTLALLNQRFSDHEFVGRHLTQQQLDEALSQQQLDFVVTNPVHFMLNHGQALNWLASYLDSHYGQARASVAGTLWVRADRPITKPEQLRGHTVGAVHEQAFGGFLLVAEQLRRRQILLSELKVTFQGYPLDKLVYDLQQGALDVAILPSCLLEDMASEGLLKQEDFRALMVEASSPCVRSTPLYPGWSFASVGNIEEPLLREITQALLSFELAGRAQWGASVRLDEVAQLLMDWQLGPEPKPLAHWALLQQFIEQHWPWLAGFIALLLGHLLYHSRVAVLLHRRTKECEQLYHQVQQKEQALAQARQRTLMGEMATGLAHELNQPLSAIQAYAQAGELMQDPVKHQAAFSHIVEETERGAAIIRRFRQWATQALPSAAPFELADLCQELIVRIRPRADALAVQLALDLTPGTLLSIRPAIEQILNNLLSNALDAHERRLQVKPTHQGWIRVTLSQLAAEQEQSGWQLIIEDNAGGIDDGIISTLQHNLPASHYHGMGIGLLVSHRLALRLQGQLSLSNTEQGTQARLVIKESE